MSLLKIPLLLATASGITVGFTPPRPPPKEDERKTYEKAANGEALPTVGSYGLVPFKVSGAQRCFASLLSVYT